MEEEELAKPHGRCRRDRKREEEEVPERGANVGESEEGEPHAALGTQEALAGEARAAAAREREEDRIEAAQTRVDAHGEVGRREGEEVLRVWRERGEIREGGWRVLWRVCCAPS